MPKPFKLLYCQILVLYIIIIITIIIKVRQNKPSLLYID
jgi:hypothetical protein